VGAEALVTRNSRAIMDASHVVLPGVGAFKDCMRHLEEYGLIGPVMKCIEKGKPFLGICLGLQLLFEESEEFGTHKGLGVIKGRVVSLPGGQGLKVPHMGWNEAKKNKDSALLEGIEDDTFFYFVHSYYAVPEDRSIDLTTTGYGVE